MYIYTYKSINKDISKLKYKINFVQKYILMIKVNVLKLIYKNVVF